MAERRWFNGKAGRVRVALLAASTMVALLAIPDPGGAVANQTTGLYEMNEPAGTGTRVLVDSSGNALNGTIGSDVLNGVSFNGAIGHKFPWVLPNKPPANPNRLDQIPNSTLLNPGTRDYAVTVRYRTTQNFGNVIQKGQAGSVNTGGYWKWEQPFGIVMCLFRDANTSVNAKSPIALNDGQWHTVRCERTATRLTMTVDDTHVVRRNARPHNISNTRPITIGGKLNCDQVEITCDYFVGEIDYVRIERG